ASSVILDAVLERAHLEDAQRVPWTSFRPDHVPQHKLRLIVANAIANCDRAREFFAWLHQHFAAAPTLAILPADDADLIRVASTVVDDFLVCPVREDELYHRMLRLLGPPVQSREELHATLAGQVGLQRLLGEDQAFLDALLPLSCFG